MPPSARPFAAADAEQWNAFNARARNGHFTGEGFLSSASGEPEPMPVREPERSVALI